MHGRARLPCLVVVVIVMFSGIRGTMVSNIVRKDFSQRLATSQKPKVILAVGGLWRRMLLQFFVPGSFLPL